MNPVLRGVVIYLFLLIIFRITGKRTLADTNTFELVLLLIISEVTQQALVGEDFSLTTSMILIVTLIGTDLILSFIKNKSKPFDKVAESVPLILVQDGKPLRQRMKLVRVDEEDVMESARLIHGLERMDQIKYAVLERDGAISIIPKEK